MYGPIRYCTVYLTPWSIVLLEKLTGLQLVKKFPTFYGTRRFITTFQSVCHLCLSWASSIQSIPPIYTWLSQVVSFPQVSPPKHCIRLSSPPYMYCIYSICVMQYTCISVKYLYLYLMQQKCKRHKSVGFGAVHSVSTVVVLLPKQSLFQIVAI
jgi:membrane-bound metal-dependent hydrolase YbcI (DUF457 family)